MSLLDKLIPELKPWAQALFDLARQAGVRPAITSALRSYAEQDRLYKDFLAGRAKYTVAAPGTSAHEFGYAFDMVVATPTDQADLGMVWRSWGGIYGGTRDPVHFEYPGFVSPRAPTVPSEPEVPSGASIRSKAEALVDQIFFLVPIPLRGILNTGVIASQIASIFGSDLGRAVDWLLTHPAELADFAADLIWNYWKQVLFGAGP